MQLLSLSGDMSQQDSRPASSLVVTRVASILAGSLLGLSLLFPIEFFGQVNRQPTAKRAAGASESELLSAQKALDLAKGSGDLTAMVQASRHVIALTYRQLGRSRLSQGRSQDASELLLRSIHFEDAPQTREQLVTAYSKQERNSSPSRPDDAQALPSEQEKKLAQILAGALNDLGASEARHEDYALALDHLKEAETWDASAPGLMRNLGMTAMRLANYSEAARSLRMALGSRPDDQIVRSLLGTALFSTNAFGEAVEVLKPLGDSVLEQPELAYTEAASLVTMNRFAEATTLLDKLQKQTLSTELRMLVAQTWSQMGNYGRTVEACKQAEQTDSKLWGAHYLAGLALIRLDQPAEAAQEFRRELELDPSNADAEFHLAFVLLQQSQNEEARDWLGKVLANKPEHPEANYELGKELVRNGKLAQAIPYLEAASRLKPDFEAVHYQLQAAYRGVGRREDADREAKIYRDMKAKSRAIKLPPPAAQAQDGPARTQAVEPHEPE
jgi:tetratricopeptide (TPR) repeat protein